MSYEAPFAGLRVVDLSQGIAGPDAAMANVVEEEGGLHEVIRIISARRASRKERRTYHEHP